MRKIYKITVFLLIVTIVLNISIGLDNKHFLRLGLGEVEAEAPWVAIATMNTRHYSDRRSCPFVYEPSKYKYRAKGYNFACSACNKVSINVIDMSNHVIFNMVAFYEGEIRDIDNESLSKLVSGQSYRLDWGGTSSNRSCKYCYDDIDAEGCVSIYRQLKNNNPILTLAQPTSNSPLNEAGTFTMSGTVTDPDEDTLTISATIGGIAKSTTVAGPATNNTWSLSWTGAELPEGQYSNIDVSVSDGKGGTDTKSYTYTIVVDKTKPNSPTISANTAWTKAASVPITITNGTDTGGSGVARTEYMLSGATSKVWTTYSSGFNITAVGQTTISARTIDKAGNTSSTKTAKVKIDRTAPTLTLTQSPAAGTWTNGSVTITATGSDTGGSSVEEIVKPDNGNVAGASTTYIVSANGTYTFIVRDKAGNETTKSIAISNIDKTAPTLTLTQSPAAGTWTNGSVTITATGSDTGGSSVEEIVKPDNGNVAGASTTYTVSANGTYTFKVRDKAGNETTKTITISNIDKVPPTAKIESVNATGPESMTVAVSATDVGSGLHPTETYMYNRDGVDIGSWTNSSTFNDTGLNPNTQYSYKVKAKDSVGNIGPYSNIVSKYTKALNPTKVQVLENGTNFIKVKITNSLSNGVIPDTKLILKAKGTNIVIAETDWSKDDGKTISGVEEGQKYDLYLNVKNENGIDNGEIKLSSTSNPPLYSSDGITLIDEIVTVISVENFRITETSVSTIRTEWNNVQGQEYQVYLKDASNNEIGRSPWISSTDLTLDYTFTGIGLLPNTKYMPHIITRIKDNVYSTEPIFVSNTDKAFTDAEGIGRARFTPGEDFIIVELAVESLDNPNDTTYVIRNDITGQTVNVSHDDPVWTNKGLAKESEYEYSVKVNHKNLKESYFTRVIFENGLNNGKSAHTIIAAIEIPDDLIVTPGEVINPGEAASSYDPENMEGKIINIDGVNYVLTKTKKTTIQNSPSKPVVNATKYATSTNNIGFNAWYDMKPDGTFAQPVMFNMPGFYINQIKFKNSLGRETDNWAEINYLADWVIPEVVAEKKIPYQSATSGNFTITVNTTDNVSPYLFYSVDEGTSWYSLPDGINEITFNNIEKNADGILNNLTIKIGDLCGNVIEKSFAIWGISK